MVPRGTYVSASAPARIDLAGGWTDTTPITHEHGGKVVNVAVKINDRVRSFTSVYSFTLANCQVASD
ncbi:hypothetical protein BGZ54_000532 [Gamsiella multidivaricata]|nr:hypothetical protein BGZ54_000532 [Gamsiella multidivaricata]